MRKVLAILLALSMSTLLLAGCGGSGGDTIKIGVFEPASGDNGAGGKQEVLGIEFANSQVPTIDIGGKTYKVQLEVVDNQSSTDKAPSAAQTLVSKGVKLVLGSYGSAVSIAASDVFGKAGLPVIGISCTNPQVTSGNDFYYRICYLDPFQGTVLANFAADQYKAKTAYILTKLGDDYSVGLGNYFKEAFEKLGGTVVAATFPEGNSDFTAFLTNAANANADVFFAPTSTDAASLIISQAASQGLNIPILAGDTWDNSVILDAAKGSSLDVSVSTFFDEGDKSTAGSTFVQDFKAWLNANAEKKQNNGGNDIVSAVSALGYDAYMTALQAIKNAGSVDSAKILAAMPATTYTGVTGDIKFDDNGDALRTQAYIKSVDTANAAWKFVAIQGIK
ncbi:branched-chain amino acid transport system substrate-binding protein [Sporobacter termitidis DSM 10068]|uniref:Branched-chain amino acid transport system substrate-binding protein n=1 Tax=Sporobacter termitidis DSM 10068 TaxID=1123282 RepID=A0A1M5YKP9_9FIRM|nr:ABC transporter substrate-binding protein [Sporobacter termitidis]SHI12489.1 branched-chain amino acid transport system substrate-binding protein [Sporobacter termitidis DSM 10068]